MTRATVKVVSPDDGQPVSSVRVKGSSTTPLQNPSQLADFATDVDCEQAAPTASVLATMQIDTASGGTAPTACAGGLACFTVAFPMGSI